ncbi:hypothetical protein [Pelomonas sp. Root1237]|uniref:hypothetical protein n=1 Tax=Pelomonas sp. Root1237 TaxID=1736434 RepID=UPI0006FE6B38|nr:hypothetical protein [Pelomonas sp. Root1237]KQV89106.1 hypothetical protein ASC91_10745 [Pelomonas sp. Root1237]
MTEKEHQRRIYVPQGHQLRATGAESVQRDGVETRISYFEVVDPEGVRVGSYVVREAQSINPPFAASVTVETVE